MENEKLCVFCGVVGPHKTEIVCEGSPKTTFEPSGDSVLFGQIINGEAFITIHDDMAIEDIAALMSGLMDKIAQFPQVRDNPMAILGAIQRGMTP